MWITESVFSCVMLYLWRETDHSTLWVTWGCTWRTGKPTLKGCFCRIFFAYMRRQLRKMAHELSPTVFLWTCAHTAHSNSWMQQVQAHGHYDTDKYDWKGSSCRGMLLITPRKIHLMRNSEYIFWVILMKYWWIMRLHQKSIAFSKEHNV